MKQPEDVDVAPVEGFTMPGFESVAEAFQRNFREHGEIGAAFAVVQEGSVVVDLWAGEADPRRAWAADTIQVIFSGTKGLVALCLLMLVDRGLIDPSAPVSEYWPEFGQRGKASLRVEEVASHQARLPAIAQAISQDDILDPERMASLLAAQEPDRDPRAGDAYHALTFGWLCGELIRRVDGRTVGRFFAEEVAGPLGLDVWIGLPESLESRVATLYMAKEFGADLYDADRLASDELLRRVYMNPSILRPTDMPWNRPAFHRAEIAGAGAIGSARSIARLYCCLACGGHLDGVRLLSADTLSRGVRCLARRREALTDEPMAYGLGFALQTDLQPMGPPTLVFGHCGAGGSAHAAWPDHKLGVSYCMNYMRDDQDVDPRPQALLAALYDCVR